MDHAKLMQMIFDDKNSNQYCEKTSPLVLADEIAISKRAFQYLHTNTIKNEYLTTFL